MGMTVANLIEYLKTQDQDATVQVVVHENERSYEMQGGSVSEQEFDPSVHVEYTDFRTFTTVKPTEPYYNKRYLLLGAMNQ